MLFSDFADPISFLGFGKGICITCSLYQTFIEKIAQNADHKTKFYCLYSYGFGGDNAVVSLNGKIGTSWWDKTLLKPLLIRVIQYWVWELSIMLW